MYALPRKNENYFRQNCGENPNTHYIFSNSFPPQTLCYLSHNVEKCCRAGQATEDNIMWHMYCACWMTKATDTH